MMTDKFFGESKEQFQVKTAIVTKYFVSWANVMRSSIKRYPHMSSDKIAYIDLFAGPGRFTDGTISTPLLILETAIADAWLKDHLVTIFNDKDEKHVGSLEEAIATMPHRERLKYEPTIMNEEVGDRIVAMFEEMRLIPTLFFVDPWGYKGLSLRLINSVVKDWGCDAIFFFNYNRINMGLHNLAVREHMEALFGVDCVDDIVNGLSEFNDVQEKELFIIESLVDVIRSYGERYVLPFRFKNEKGTRTSHHLFFVSKHVKGYNIMKDIMAKQSSSDAQGVPSFEYNQASVKFPLLFELNKPLEELEDVLLKTFAGEKLSVIGIFNRHHIGTPFVLPNYKAVLIELEKQGKITAEPPMEDRPSRKGEPTMADHVMITFP